MWLPGRGEGKSGGDETEAGTNGAQREVRPPPPQSLPSFPGQIYNLGTGTGYSVLQMVQAMEKASGKKVRLAAHPAPPPAPHTDIPDGHLSPAVYSSLPEALTPESETLLHASISGGLVSNLAYARAGSARLHPPPLLQIPYKVVARREGDVAACYANPSLALKELGWSAALGLDRMCECSP